MHDVGVEAQGLPDETGEAANAGESVDAPPDLEIVHRPAQRLDVAEELSFTSEAGNLDLEALAVDATPQLEQVALGTTGDEVPDDEQHARPPPAHDVASTPRIRSNAPSISARASRRENRPPGPRHAPSDQPRRRS